MDPDKDKERRRRSSRAPDDTCDVIIWQLNPLDASFGNATRTERMLYVLTLGRPIKDSGRRKLDAGEALINPRGFGVSERMAEHRRNVSLESAQAHSWRGTTNG